MEATEFLPIRVSTLRGDLKIPFDVYVRVAGKHILYCRKGDSFEGARLTRLKEKKLKKMFIVSDHEGNYRAYLNQNIEMAYEGTLNKSLENRAQVIQGAQQAAAEDVMEDPESVELYGVAKMGCDRYVQFIAQNHGALKAILDIENSDKSIGHHGVTVATLALGVAQKLGLTESHALVMNTLVLGCLLHDIEHQYSQFHVARPVAEMSGQDLRQYQLHPVAGVERIHDLNHFDPTVINVIRHHEERVDGSGYPYGLQEKDLEPTVMLAALANAYDRLTTWEGFNHKGALKHLLIEQMGKHPLDYLRALQDVLKDRGII